MNRAFINDKRLRPFLKDSFEKTRPYPWQDFHEFLTVEGFQRLYREFPSLELFEKHEGLERGYGQRSADRYYLACQESHYHPSGYQGKGLAQLKDLPECWQRFIKELEGKDYREFVKSALGTSKFRMRYAWHRGITHSEIPPHRDVLDKMGLHLFYFNTSEDWDVQWGGFTLVLGDKLKNIENPDFSDFAVAIPIPFLDNRSFFFKNTPKAWHGVKPLQCPEDKHRKIFSVIFEAPDTWMKKSVRRLKRFILRNKVYPGEKR